MASLGNKDAIQLNLFFKPPYDWQTIIRFYESHPIPGVERVTEYGFERVFRIGNSIGFLQVRSRVDESHLELRVVTEEPKILPQIASRVRKMFDLDSDPVLIADSLARVPLLARLCDRFPGLRLPGGWDAFETAICSILGQLVSAEQRSNLIGQLVHAYGDEIFHPLSGEKTRLFPGPEVLAKSDLSEVKTTGARREAIRNFSCRVLGGAISLSEAQDPMEFRKALLETKGIGPWSAEYISLRAIRDTDAFPKTDLILKRVLERHPDFDFETVKPWRSYAAIYLWKGFAQLLSKRKRRNNMTLYYKEMASPVGKVKLIASSEALVAVLWEQEQPNRVKFETPKLDPHHPILLETERQLSEYFAGQRTRFNLPLAPRGTKFQMRVWQALREIPFGQTRSYLDLAKAIGSPKAFRAVGAANGKNPLSIVVPCHRVNGADGSLTGFAGGLQTKSALLAFEASAVVSIKNSEVSHENRAAISGT
jgi:O-6-methylguanine DNA methyltransferase